MRIKFVLILPLLVMNFISSCKSSQSEIKYTLKARTSKYYTASFPNKDVSVSLQKIQQASYKIITTSYYNTYRFNQSNITLADIQSNKLTNLTSDKTSDEESTSGTSILLESNNEKALLLTCNHVVAAPDTVITYIEHRNFPPKTFIQSVSIKQRQNNLIFTPDKLYDFKTIAANPRSDLALINAFLGDNHTFGGFPKDLQVGNSNLLKPGSFLYILGFPKGYAMVTQGLASPTNNTAHRFFMTDALFNPGISGGMIIATKNNFNSFEWVGMACSASADTEDYLVPRAAPTEYDRRAELYHDSVFVQKKTHISYGVTRAVSVNQIKSFIQQNRATIKQRGFTLSVQ